MPHGSVVVLAVHVAKCAPRDGRQDGRSGVSCTDNRSEPSPSRCDVIRALALVQPARLQLALLDPQPARELGIV